jgi:hypothetical protein
METTIHTQIDEAIDNYKLEHGGNNPIFCIMSADEADELTASLRQRDGLDENVIITSYRDVKIVRNDLIERGKYLLTNELPETGS